MKKNIIILLITLMIFPTIVYAQDKKIVEINGKKYCYLDGKKCSGFQEIDGKIYFFSRINDNAMRTGTFGIDGPIYHFNEDGTMHKGWYESNGNKYYFDSTGKRVSGFQTIDGKTYFFSRINDNPMRTGIFSIDGPTYRFLEDGSMYKGWYESEGKKYYFTDSGKRASGFQKIDGKTYFFSRINDNYLRNGWLLIDNYMYYFDPSTNEMVTGNRTIDDVNYIFYSNGRLKDGFVTDSNGNVRYYYPNGKFANDWVTIAGKKYFFNSLGVMIGQDVMKIIDVSAYQNDIDWAKVVKEGKVDGAIIRISAGCDYEDKKLARNIAEIKKVGIPYGIYIYSYAENYNEGVLYANFTTKMIKKYNMNPTLGIYLDLESNGITKYMGTKEYTNVVNGYMDTMKKNGYGSLTKIYTYKNYADTALNTTFMRNQITWIAQYYHYPTYSGYFKMWQYSSTEKVPGISGNVDMSVLFKNK